jgi:Spy/CpxP family protein refolding chaperone
MNHLFPIAFASFFATSALAQQPPQRPQGPPRIDVARELNLSPEKAKQVDAILQNEMEQHRAARERSRAELAKILSADEMAKLDSLRPRPPGPPPAGR